MQQFFPIGGEASVLANAISVALCEKMTIEEQNIWGNLLVLVGSSMLSIAAINESLSKSTGDTPNTSDKKSG